MIAGWGIGVIVISQNDLGNTRKDHVLDLYDLCDRSIGRRTDFKIFENQGQQQQFTPRVGNRSTFAGINA